MNATVAKIGEYKDMNRVQRRRIGAAQRRVVRQFRRKIRRRMQKGDNK